MPILAEARHAARMARGPMGLRYPPRMIDRYADPRTDDTIVYELVRTPLGASDGEVVGRATFHGGATIVDAPDAVRLSVEELLSRPFVDRMQADERPRGYRRSGRGAVDFLVPGMPEHFMARLRGLWLSYPDGSVVTARSSGGAGSGASIAPAMPESTDTGTPVTDAARRRTTLTAADRSLGARPLVRGHAPETGLRPAQELSSPGSPVSRTDCGWLV